MCWFELERVPSRYLWYSQRPAGGGGRGGGGGQGACMTQFSLLGTLQPGSNSREACNLCQYFLLGSILLSVLFLSSNLVSVFFCMFWPNSNFYVIFLLFFTAASNCFGPSVIFLQTDSNRFGRPPVKLQTSSKFSRGCPLGITD